MVNMPMKIWFRQKKTLVINTIEIPFIIFSDQNSENYFITILTSRTKSKELKIISENFTIRFCIESIQNRTRKYNTNYKTIGE